MKQSVIYLKKLTSAEVGTTKAHVGGYIRLPNDFDYDLFFQNEGTDNNGVTEIIFSAYNLNKGIVEPDLRFAYFGNSNKERRIPNLATLYKDNDVEEGDVVKLESRISEGKAKVYIQFFKNSEVRTSASNIFFVRNEGDRGNSKNKSDSIAPLQQIFYGAPGTGKSHKIKNDEKVKKADEKNLVFRTTFHPDSDYSTFVGAYKPTMQPVADKYKAVAGKDEEITYSFVPQSFLQAYVAAWNNPEDDVFLVIEEINRGNCAQIFGDLFQLLDRDCDGFSEYPIMADKDLAKYLKGKDENGREVLTNKEGIKDGKLKLPKNLYIWATMNTSDQSLFPIDSAFKRRWEWVYQPIDTAKETWYVKIGEEFYSWTAFLNKVNDELLTDETAEDKHLGFYFCKATERKVGTEQKPNVITAETFVGKVLFYLWNDVFKVYGIPSAIASSKDWPYRKFYLTSGEVDTGKVVELMEKLQIEACAS